MDQSREEFHGLLSLRSGGEYGSLVILQNLQPFGDIGSVILAHFRRDVEIRAQECACNLRDQFFACITFIAPLLAAEVTVEARRVLCPVRRLMRERCIEALRVPECLDRRQLNIVTVSAVIGPVAAVADVRFCCSEECVSLGDALDRSSLDFGLRIVDLSRRSQLWETTP